MRIKESGVSTMWECPKCHDNNEDTFDLCWNCGADRDGAEKAAIQPAEQIDLTLPERSVPERAEDQDDDTESPRLPSWPEDYQRGYEFSPDQKGIISSLATSMTIVGVFSLIGGALLGLAGCLLSMGRGGAPLMIEGVVGLIVGVFTLTAAGAFRRIVQTPGDEIHDLMSALRALRKLYQLQVFLLCLVLVFAILAVCLFSGAADVR
jgi:hypothetical protein